MSHVPQHCIDSQLLNIITRPVIGANACLEVNDGDVTIPAVYQIVFALEPVFGVNGIHGEGFRIRVNEPWPCDFPSLYPCDFTVCCQGMVSSKIVLLITIWRRPFLSFSGAPLTQIWATACFEATLNFTKMECQTLEDHAKNFFFFNIKPMTSLPLIFFPFSSATLIDQWKVMFSPGQRPFT